MARSSKTVVAGAAVAILAVVALVAVVTRDDGDGLGPTRPDERPSIESIPADCSRPVEALLNRYMALTPDGSTVRLRPGGCYGIDGPLVLAARNDFTLDGAGATIRALTPGGEQRANVDVRRGRNVTVANVTVEGAFPGPAPDGGPGNGPRNGNVTGTQHGVYVRSVQGGTFRDIRALNTGGECVAVMSDFDPVQGFVGGPSQDILIERLGCRHTGRQGVAIIDAERVVLRQSDIGDAHDCAIDIEADVPTQVTRQIRIEDNTFGRTRFAAICHGGQGTSPNVADITVARNTMTVAPSTCFGAVYIETPPQEQAAGGTRTGYTFVENTFRSISYTFFVSGVTDMEISRNTIEGGLPGSPGCTDFAKSPPEPQPGVDAYNVHKLYGSGNRWSGYSRIVRADPASTDVGPLDASTPP